MQFSSLVRVVTFTISVGSVTEVGKRVSFNLCVHVVLIHLYAVVIQSIDVDVKILRSISSNRDATLPESSDCHFSIL